MLKGEVYTYIYAYVWRALGLALRPTQKAGSGLTAGKALEKLRLFLEQKYRKHHFQSIGCVTDTSANSDVRVDDHMVGRVGRVKKRRGERLSIDTVNLRRLDTSLGG